MEYRDLPQIDFFVIDEFYKLSAKRDDERSDVLNNAFHFLLKQNSQFYLLGPNIDGISEGFAETFNAEFLKTNYSLVDNQVVDIYSQHKEKFPHPIKHAGYKEQVLFDLLFSLKSEQTIIYCSSPERVRKLSAQFANYLEEKNFQNEKSKDLSLVEWINNNISSSWSVARSLEFGIGIHDGALPKHMTSSVINYFNSNQLNYLFCTSTIIEGVNTSAKNIIYFDPKKGGKPIDYFDYSNIRGRSGRMMIHYVGKIYNFNKPPEKDDVIIDIPFYEQNPVTPEILIHLEESEVRSKESVDYKNILKIPEVEKNIIKKNGLSVSGQQQILEILKNDAISRPNLIFWTGLPKYDELKYLISLAWSYLLKPGESTSPFTEKQIAYITFDYGTNKSIRHLINNQFTYFQTLAKYREHTQEQILDEAIRFSFQTMKHWFGYKVPKWLLTLNNLQKYVASLNGQTPGDYSFYAGQIENDFIQPNMVILNEYGVPRSAIEKLSPLINPDWNENQVMSEVERLSNSNKENFLAYELEKINECI